ncbi:hypothetical protein B8W95_13540, partial [Staphylococcus pasteuri]
EVEDVDDRRHDLELTVFGRLLGGGAEDVGGYGETPEVVDELLADLDLEVVRQKLEKAGEPLWKSKDVSIEKRVRALSSG